MAYTYSDLKQPVYKIGEVARITGKSVPALQNWDNKEWLRFERTKTGRRFLTRESLIQLLRDEGLFYETNQDRKDVIYARVSSLRQKQNGDLDRQITFILESQHDLINPIVLSEVGSGLNDKRKQLLKLLSMVQNDEVSRVFITYKDRLTRFGFNYLKTICDFHNVEIVIIKDANKPKTIEQELSEDLTAIITSFSGKLYGLRSHSNNRKEHNGG